MFRNMVTSLFKHDQIRTTDAKAKELRRWADQLVTLAKRGDLHARRRAMAIIREKESGTMEQLIVTPLRPGEMILGKTIPFIIIAQIQMVEKVVSVPV